jgi:REP-associated tyrosine transposase
MFKNRPRLRTFDYRGRYRYFLTFCTYLRREVFVSHAVVDPVRSQILQFSELCGFTIPAYCFMPDHLHLLVEGQADHSDLRDFVKRAKQSSGFTYRRQRAARLWQSSYYDHVLRENEASLWSSRTFCGIR